MAGHSSAARVRLLVARLLSLPRRLLVPGLLVGLLLGGLTGAGPASAGTAATARPAVTAGTAAVSTAPAAAPAGPGGRTSRGSAVTHGPRSAVLLQDGAAGDRTPTGLPLALPPRAGASTTAPLLLGQLPRPPSTTVTSTEPDAARGRAPPTTAGT